MPWPLAGEPGLRIHQEEEGPRQRADRMLHLAAARDLLATALEALDVHARSPAAATVDLAIHQINVEIGG